MSANEWIGVVEVGLIALSPLLIALAAAISIVVFKVPIGNGSPSSSEIDARLRNIERMHKDQTFIAWQNYNEKMFPGSNDSNNINYK